VDFTETADVTLERGNIDLRPAKTGMGKIAARTNTGDIDLSLPPGAKFTLSAETRRGEVQNDFGAPLSVESRHEGGSFKRLGGARSGYIPDDEPRLRHGS
jgi:DUF4097 and DUF4098 domain-containing protein YvlB